MSAKKTMTILVAILFAAYAALGLLSPVTAALLAIPAAAAIVVGIEWDRRQRRGKK